MANVRDSFRLAVSTLFVAVVPILCFAQQFPEQNVNMVSGTGWPGGDPFLRQQNEPSLAISTRNPLHLLAGANDYRSVDIPFNAPARPDDEETGDAWLGYFISKDGGNTWFSTLLDGYPQLVNSSSPLKGFQAAADPVVRAANNGLFYYAGIVLNRGDHPLGGVFVARFIDRNNTEIGNPIAYLDTKMIDRGTSGQFIDKPWFAVAPMTNGGQCTVDGQVFPAQNVYLAYSVFVGNDNNIHTKMMFTKSSDCGATWDTPQKLSETFTINQGATIAVDPSSGTVYVFWRRFHGGNDPDSIIMAKSTNGGTTFSKGAVVTNITPFEQGTTGAAMRTNAYPAAAVDSSGRVYVAWSQRIPVTPTQNDLPNPTDGRIVLSTSTDGGTTWSSANPIDIPPGRGHQFMPTMTFASGKVTVAWYDVRQDHTTGTYKFSNMFPGFYEEARAAVGNLVTPVQPQVVFWNYLSDTSPFADLTLKLRRRHTLDVRVAENDPAAPLSFRSTRVTRFKFGFRQNSTTCGPMPPNGMCIEDYQLNPPNLPMFRQGTVPFFGDYIDVSAYTPGASRVRHVVWTDNRDVRAPLGTPPDWTKYTPVHSPALGNTSIFDPSQRPPDCTTDIHGNAQFVSSRNQNIYTTRVTDGMFSGSPGNTKPLGTIQRAFTVFVQNARSTEATYRLSIADPQRPFASFKQFDPSAYTVDVTIPPHSTATRTVFVAASAPQHTRIDVTITEIGGSGLSSVVSLNPDPTNPDIGNPDIGNAEVFTPDIGNPDIGNPDIGNNGIPNPDIGNTEPMNPDIGNPDIGNPDIGNPDIGNPDIGNPDIGNPDIGNTDLVSGSASDTGWDINNRGNTTGGYTVKLLKNGEFPATATGVQLILSKTYDTPVARNCNLGVEHHRQLVANIRRPAFATSLAQLFDPLDPSFAKSGDATIWLAPGDVGRITIRVVDPTNKCPYPLKNCLFNASTIITPVIIAQSVNTADAGPNGTHQPAFAIPLFISTDSLADGNVGTAYSVTLQSIGGAGTTRTWTVEKGLPLGLSLNASTGVLSGTPILPVDSFVTFRVADAANPPNTRTRTLSLHVSGTQQQIPAITPPIAAAGFGQLVFIDIANYFLPDLTGAKVWFTDGRVVEEGFLFRSPSTPGAIYARLPFVGDSFTTTNLKQGPITVYVTRPGTVRGPGSITLATKPGTPTLRSVYSLGTPPTQANPCGSGLSGESVTAIMAGEGVAVSAYGTDTVGAKLRFTQGDSTTDVNWSCAYDSPSLGEAAVFTVPTFLQPGSVDIAISTVVSGQQSDWSAVRTLTVVAPSPLAITTTALPDAYPPDANNAAYSTALNSSGGSPPIHWSVSSGVLPTGLTLSDGGIISGTPARADFEAFDVRATDSGQPQQTATKTFGIQAWAKRSAFCGGGTYPLFNNTNIDTALNGGSAPTVSAIGRQNGYVLKAMFTYHWNDGHGSVPVNPMIGFTQFDPWPVHVEPATNNVPANWIATIPAGVILSGTYTVYDSEPATWSQNSGSNGGGFTVVCVQPYFPIG
jgi:hypothetical protein